MICPGDLVMPVVRDGPGGRTRGYVLWRQCDNEMAVAGATPFFTDDDAGEWLVSEVATVIARRGVTVLVLTASRALGWLGLDCVRALGESNGGPAVG